MTDPKWNPPGGPKGYGDPHRPAGGFRVETKALIDASHTWDDVATALHKVWNYAKVGWDTWGIFGSMDTLYSAGKIQSGINEDLVNAAEDGYAIVTGLANGLVEVANEYENTDTTHGDKFRSITRRA